jgi:hypothetical protein
VPSFTALLSALTNFKHALKQICRRLERREFALDVAIHLAGFDDAAQRAILGLPAADVPREVIQGAEFGFTGKSKWSFTAQHPLHSKVRSTWGAAVQGVFALLTGSNVWPPEGVPPAVSAAALQLRPASVQLYRGLKITRAGVSNVTLQCSPSFHGRPRQDTVLLSGGPDFEYDDVHAMEYGLVHCFFSYSDAGLTDLLRWGADEFEVDVEDDAFAQYSQFFLMQRYRPSALGNQLLPLRYYAAKELSNDYETESVAAIYSRARPFPWFHSADADDDMKKKKGAIFCQFK